MKKYFLPLESLFCHFPVKVSDELRYRGEGELRYCDFALFVRKDSDRLMTVESKDGETIFRSLFYLLPASVAETFTRIYDEEDIERGYDDLTLHLFREAGDGSVDYTESCLRIGEVLEQSALKKTLPANCQSDDVFVVPLHFLECVCPVCGKTTIPQNSFGGAICPVCGWCELRMEDEMSESARREKYAEQLALDPNFMYDDPIDGYGFICPLSHRKEN